MLLNYELITKYFICCHSHFRDVPPSIARWRHFSGFQESECVLRSCFCVDLELEGYFAVYGPASLELMIIKKRG